MINLATVVLLATILQGEAGLFGTDGMELVAGTMSCRYAEVESWSDVTKYYYGRQTPTFESFNVAQQLFDEPGKFCQGYHFVYSRSDRLRMGWGQGDLVVKVSGLELNLSESYPGG